MNDCHNVRHQSYILCIFAASTRCRLSLPCPTRPAWLNVQQKRWHFVWCGKYNISEINNTQINHCQAYTHTDGRALFASGSPFPDFQGFGKVREDFISCFLSIGNIFFVNTFGENQFICRLTSPARATMRTSSLVPAWRSLLQVKILGILCWLELTILTLLITFHPQGSITFRTEFSSPRRKLWQIWCPRKILRSAGKKKTRQHLVGPRSVGFNPTFCGQYHSDVTTEIFFRLYPPLSNIQEISVQIAKKVYTIIGFDCHTLK